MSLLLDALKEAQKQRKGAEITRSPKTGVDENELELELELNFESDLPVSVEGDGENLVGDIREVQSPPEQASKDQQFQNHSPEQEASTVKPPAFLATGSAKALDSVEGSESHNSPHSANAVFHNRGRHSTKRHFVIGLAFIGVVVLVFIGYLIFLSESSSRPLQQALRTKNINPAVKVSVDKTSGTSEGKSLVSKVDSLSQPTQKPVGISGSEMIDPTKQADNKRLEAKATVIVQEVVSSQTVGFPRDVENTSTLKGERDTHAVESRRVEAGMNSNAKQIGIAQANNPAIVAAEPFTGIQIRKRRIPAKRNENLQRGQQALVSADLASAASSFTSVLKTSPSNVTALLGMASVYEMQGENNQAQLYYHQVLAQNPQNLMARVGMLSLANSNKLSVGSSLKQLLLESPEKAFLHASLGDYYLKRRQWAPAQAAYFDAFSRDSKNANYAYNLAVCLDQMAKPELALQFYQQALDLKTTVKSGFDNAVLVERIAVLRALH